jgi:hypothetical protein
MPVDFQPVRFPKRKLTPEQVAKFAALRQEVEHELAARRAQRAEGRPKPGLLARLRQGRLRTAQG